MLSKDFFIKREKGRFLNLPSLVLDNLNIEVNNGFIFQPLTVERKLNMTAPMQISGERGSLCNFLIRKQYKKGFGSFSAIGACRTNAGSEGTRKDYKKWFTQGVVKDSFSLSTSQNSSLVCN